jgi:hypothetical protein
MIFHQRVRGEPKGVDLANGFGMLSKLVFEVVQPVRLSAKSKPVKDYIKI